MVFLAWMHLKIGWETNRGGRWTLGHVELRFNNASEQANFASNTNCERVDCFVLIKRGTDLVI